jgi:hypothetical protein
MKDDLQGASEHEGEPTEESRQSEAEQREKYIDQLKGEKGDAISQLHEMERKHAELEGRFSQLTEFSQKEAEHREESTEVPDPYGAVREMLKDEELKDQLDDQPSKAMDIMLEVMEQRETAMRAEMAQNWTALGGRDEAIKEAVSASYRKDLQGLPDQLKLRQEMEMYTEEFAELDKERPEYKNLEPAVKLQIIKDLKGETKQSGYPGAAGFGRPVREERPKVSKAEVASARSMAERMFAGREDAEERIEGYVKRFIQRKEG